MKLRIGILFAVILWCVLLAFPCSAYFIDRNDSGELLHFYVSPGSVTPTIDGVISDDEYMPFPIDYNNDISLVVPREAAIGALDIEANTLHLSYDEKYVYIAATTSAAHFHNGCEDNISNMWGQHCLQISLADVNDDDASMRLEVGYGLSSNTGVMLFKTWNDGQGVGYSDTVVAGRDFVVARKGDKLIYELRIPYKAFQARNARAGDAIRLCVVWATGTSEGDRTDEYRLVQLAYGCAGDPGKDVTGHAVIHLTERQELPGDLNGDGSVDILDASLLLQHSVFPELYPISCHGSIDFTLDGTVDIRDAVRLLRYSMYPEDYPIEELRFVSNGDGTCSVYGNGNLTDTEIVIPETSPAGDRVTGIGDQAFDFCSSLTSVAIPDSVTSIGDDAFYKCSSLTSVTIPDSVTSIGEWAFCDCPYLTSLTLPDSVTYIGSGAFCDCSSLTSIIIPNSVTSIGDLAFDCCSSLTSVTIPDSVTSIGGSAFYDCSSLTSVTIPDSVTSIGSYTFGCCSSLTSVIIPDSVTSIGIWAFTSCSSLTSVTIPDSVTSIGEYAFCFCPALKDIDYSGTQAQWDAISKSHEWDAYTGSYTLHCTEDAGYSEGLSYTSHGDGTCHVSGIGTCTDTDIGIPRTSPAGDRVTGIGGNAFNCSPITSITIPDSVTSIGSYAFRECRSLTDIYYSGTRAQFDTVSKDRNWDTFNGSYILHCANGDFGAPTGYIFVTNGDGTCYVSGYKENTDTDIVIPARSPAGDTVTGIGAAAFSYCESLTSITVPDSVTSIGGDAFYHCSSLISVTLPDSVTSIGGNVFYYCGSLISITLPDGVTGIGGSAFRYCTSLTSITIPESVTSIGTWAFYGCEALTSVTIPFGVTDIGGHAFRNCTSLTSVTIPESVTSIGTWAFYGCEALNDIYYAGIPEQWDAVTKGDRWDTNTGSCTVHYAEKLAYTSNGDGTCYVSGIGTCTDTDLIIPETSPDGYRVTGIGGHAFRGCTSLTSITIPHSVTSIGDWAFNGCTALTSVTIPKGVTGIGGHAFRGCTSLTSITIPHSVTSIGDWAFNGCSALTSVTVPKGVTGIGGHVFRSCTSLTSVSIPESVTSIGTWAFYGCEALKDIYYSGTQAQWDAVTKGDRWDTNTGSYTVHCVEQPEHSDGLVYYSNGNGTCRVSYYGEYTLNDLIIPETSPSGERVTSFGLWAFCACDSLTSVIIPDSMTDIAGHTFSECINLRSVSIPDSITSIGVAAFDYCTSLPSITIPDSVTSIGGGAFSSCSSLTSVTIPDSVTSIGDGAFSSCSSLTSVTIPDSVTSIDDWTFSYCTSLASVIIPDSVTSIGEYAFAWCKTLTSITIPISVTNIDDWAFYHCAALTDIYYSGTQAQWDAISKDYEWDTYAGAYTVHCVENAGYSLGLAYTSNGDGTCYVSGIGMCLDTDIVIPETSPDGDLVTEIGIGAFSSCSSLTSVTIPDSVTSIGMSAFYSCSSLTSIIIPDSVTSIGDFAFDSCSSLTSVTIPDSVTSIGVYAFENCTSLTSVVIPAGMTSISDWTFYACTSLASVYIPDSVTSIGSSAFFFCTALKDIYYSGSAAQWTAIYKGSGWNDFAGTCAVHCVEEAGNSEGLAYTSNGDGTCYVSGIGTCTDEKLVIPAASPAGEMVTGIGENAFEGCTALSAVSMPDTITKIGDWAFSGCEGLTEVLLPNQLTVLGSGVFNDCIALTDIILPDTLNFIGNIAFYWCTGLKSIVIPDGVTAIDDWTFSYCSALSEVTLPDSVTSIGENAFHACLILDNIHYGGTKAQWFALCTGTTVTDTAFYAVHCSDGDLSFTPQLGFRAGGSGTCFVSDIGSYQGTDIVIPDTDLAGNTVIGIDSLAFCGCSSLTSVTIPDSVTCIDDFTFYDCGNLFSVTIPDSVTHIGDDAFFDCTSLTDIFYGGTLAQWNAVVKGEGWNSNTGSYTVHCTDGNISK